MILFLDTSRRPYTIVTEEGEFFTEELGAFFSDLSNVTRLGVGVGPGSYTGIRVGVAFAKGFSLATGCALVPIPSIQRYFPTEDGRFLSLLDAGVGGVYFQKGERCGERIEWMGEPGRCLKEDLSNQIAGVDCAVSPDVDLGVGEPASSSAYLLERVAQDPARPLVVHYLGRWD